MIRGLRKTVAVLAGAVLTFTGLSQPASAVPWPPELVAATSNWTTNAKARLDSSAELGVYVVGDGPADYYEQQGFATSRPQTNDTGLLFSIVGDLNSSCWAVGLSSPERQATNHKTMDYAIYGETDKRILFMRRGVEVNAQGQPTGTYAGYTVPQATGPNSVLALERQNGAVVARLNGTVVCTWKLSEAEANAPFVFNLSLGKHLLVNKGYDQLDGSGGHLNMTVANLRFINPALNTAPSVAMMAPVHGAVFHAPATIPLRATAADADGMVKTVEFFSGAELLATAGPPAFAAVWSNAPAGEWQLTARATDDRGAVTTTPPWPVTVTADPTPVIVADCGASAGPFEKERLLNVAQGGYSAMRNLDYFTESYDDLKQAGIRQIRFDCFMYDHFFWFSSKDASGKITYDFSRVDKLILPLLKLGMQPQMCLMGNPSYLCPEGLDKWCNAMPTDLKAWGDVAQALVAHYVQLGHKGWYWECANEPDSFSDPRWTGEQYVELYRVMASAVRAADPTAKMGGAACNQPFDWSPYNVALLKAKDQDPSLPLDFVSYHTYQSVNRGDDDFQHGYKRYEKRAPELLVTEWGDLCNMDGGVAAPMNSNVGASRTARRLSLLARLPKVRPYFFSAKDGWSATTILNGDVGLLTFNNHRKATYYVLKFVNQLGNELLPLSVDGNPPGNTDVGAIATRTRSEDNVSAVTVLAWNDGTNAAAFRLKLTRLPFKSAAGARLQVVQYLIDATHGNVAADYKTHMNYARTPSELCNPVRNEAVPAAADFAETLSLPPHSVVLLTLLPLSPGTPLTEIPNEQTGPCNRAWGQPCTASSSDESPKIGWERARVNDAIRHSFDMINAGNPNLGWRSAAHDRAEAEEWLAIDLGEPRELTSAVLYPTDLLANRIVPASEPRSFLDIDGTGFPVDFKIQGSLDGVTWTDLAARTGYQAGQRVRGPQTFALKPSTSRHLRLLATRLGGGPEDGKTVYRLQLAEMEAYGNNAGNAPQPSLKRTQGN